MRDLAQKWSPVPEWPGAVIETPGFTVRSVSGLEQLLVSGALAAWTRAAGMPGDPVGAFGTAQGDAYAVRLARDRILAVSTRPIDVAPGWHREGFAVTPMNAGLHVFEMTGPSVDAILARATTLSPDSASPSASISFAGIHTMVYRYEGATRVHVDSGLAAYLWRWLEVASEQVARDRGPA